MNVDVDEAVIAYLRSVGTIEPSLDDLRRAQARAHARRPRPRARRVVVIAIAVVAASAGIATATGLLVNPDPRPPARTIDRAVPADVRATVGVFRTPSEARDRSEDALAAARDIGAPFVVDADSLRAVGLTPLGERAYIVYATTDPEDAPSGMPLEPGEADLEGAYVVVAGRFGGVGQDGPYPLRDIKRGTALGTNEVPRFGAEAALLEAEAPAHLRTGRMITGVFPDGVRRVELVFRNGSRERHPITGNVLIAHLDAGTGDFPESVIWLGADGQTIRTVEF